MKARQLFSPLVPAMLISGYAWVQTSNTETMMIVFGMWFIAGYFSLLVFAYPLFLMVQKNGEVNIANCILISLLAALVFTMLLIVVFPPRIPWYEAVLGLQVGNVRLA